MCISVQVSLLHVVNKVYLLIVEYHAGLHVPKLGAFDLVAAGKRSNSTAAASEVSTLTIVVERIRLHDVISRIVRAVGMRYGCCCCYQMSLRGDPYSLCASVCTQYFTKHPGRLTYDEACFSVIHYRAYVSANSAVAAHHSVCSRVPYSLLYFTHNALIKAATVNFRTAKCRQR
jgi:hypothetical protein